MLPMVCYPYEFTLLSNYYSEPFDDFEFVTPMNLHCSQTLSDERQKRLMFVTPMNLHCSQTYFGILCGSVKFVTPMNLHCSQTYFRKGLQTEWFVTPMNLHCSQTYIFVIGCIISLLPL